MNNSHREIFIAEIDNFGVLIPRARRLLRRADFVELFFHDVGSRRRRRLPGLRRERRHRNQGGTDNQEFQYRSFHDVPPTSHLVSEILYTLRARVNEPPAPNAGARKLAKRDAPDLL